MKLEQVAEIVEEVRTIYPFLAREISLENMFKVYTKHLLDEEYEKVIRNLDNHVKNSKFPPSIADLVANDELKRWGTPVVIEKVPEKTPEEIAEIKRIIAEGKANLIKILNKQGGE